MKLLSLLVVAGLVATPCYAASKKMKNEPDTVGGMTCGSTPFNKFTPEQYLGRNEAFDCAKVYGKNNKKYYFNDKGQLFMVIANGKEADIAALTKRHGKPTAKKMSGSESSENQITTWTGNVVEISLVSTKSKREGHTTSTYSSIYGCVGQAVSTCGPSEIYEQSGRIDIFSEKLGVGVQDYTQLASAAERPMPSKYVIPSQETRDLVAGRIRNQGLPEPDHMEVYQNEKDAITMIVLHYKSKVEARVRKFLFAEIGDISADLENLSYTGRKSFVLMDHAAGEFSVTFQMKD